MKKIKLTDELLHQNFSDACFKNDYETAYGYYKNYYLDKQIEKSGFEAFLSIFQKETPTLDLNKISTHIFKWAAEWKGDNILKIFLDDEKYMRNFRQNPSFSSIISESFQNAINSHNLPLAQYINQFTKKDDYYYSALCCALMNNSGGLHKLKSFEYVLKLFNETPYTSVLQKSMYDDSIRGALFEACMANNLKAVKLLTTTEILKKPFDPRNFITKDEYSNEVSFIIIKDKEILSFFMLDLNIEKSHPFIATMSADIDESEVEKLEKIRVNKTHSKSSVRNNINRISAFTKNTSVNKYGLNR